MAAPRRGFSLVEVVVAMSIFAGGVLGVMGAFSVATRTGTQALRLDTAVELAERKLNAAVILPADRLQPHNGEEGIFQWQVGYTSKPHQLMAATATVTWLDRGADRRFQLTRVFLPLSVDEP